MKSQHIMFRSVSSWLANLARGLPLTTTLLVAIPLAACAPQHERYVHAMARGSVAPPPARDTADETAKGVERIKLEGNQSISDAELLAVMQLQLSDGEASTIDDDDLSMGIMRLNAYYYDLGYLAVEVKETHAKDGSNFDIRVHITEGARYRVGRVIVHEVDGKGQTVRGLESDAALRGRVALNEGQWFNRTALSKALGSIQTLYRDAGYGHVEVTVDTELTADTNVVNLTVPIVRKGLTYVSTIRVRGAKDVPLSAITRLFRIHEGELFNETRLLETKERLAKLPFLSQVDCSIEDEPDHSHIRVEFDVAEASNGNDFALTDVPSRI